MQTSGDFLGCAFDWSERVEIGQGSGEAKRLLWRQFEGFEANGPERFALAGALEGGCLGIKRLHLAKQALGEPFFVIGTDHERLLCPVDALKTADGLTREFPERLQHGWICFRIYFVSIKGGRSFCFAA